jgi:hypothetical protein
MPTKLSCWAGTQSGGLELLAPIPVSKNLTGTRSDFWNQFRTQTGTGLFLGFRVLLRTRTKGSL